LEKLTFRHQGKMSENQNGKSRSNCLASDISVFGINYVSNCSDLSHIKLTWQNLEFFYLQLSMYCNRHEWFLKYWVNPTVVSFNTCAVKM
jgi:hypothetical protein